MTAVYELPTAVLAAAHRVAETAPPLTEKVADRVLAILTTGGDAK